ncbi:CAP domain-containing protein [Sphingomonas sp. BIUV-7]|uniref:CAP domain-containing protein n=1 Tax=Sphingomonas natans TaxID=3063330 RepID=A0ABT8YFM9_9SPHN|nr:CAP domain-containing protein [Sphingomonas sp. BIUV-7]MDO6416862.1 CAP domain-containing protein [Sphingomonas sp. BIUV-7]
MAAALSAQAAVAQAPADHRGMEQAVLAALNAARTDPATYTGGLKTYRGFFKANIVVMPGNPVDYETVEGTAPVDEAIAYLASQTMLAPLQPADILAAAAADHVAEQSISGRTGHYSADGSAPSDRVVKRGGGPLVAEVIAYGAVDAADVIRQLIVDDGVPDRGHRNMLFAGHLRYAGVACGPHPEFKMMCVIDMADTPDGQSGGSLRRVRVAASDATGKK